MSSPSLRMLAAALAIAALVMLSPLALPLVLAAWGADVTRPAVRRLERALGGRRRAAAALLVLVIIAVLLPLAALFAGLAQGLRDLLVQIKAAVEGEGSLGSALLGGAGHSGAPDWADLLSRHGATAWGAVRTFLRASANVAIGVLVFVVTLYTLAVDGERAYAWLEENAPIPPSATARLVRAFRETGRGLIVAGGGTALAQGAVATLTYAALGIPRAYLFGPLTALCAIVPFVGTGLVWAPLAIELALGGDVPRAVAVLVIGAGIHSTIDNAIRPALARYGKLALPAAVVLASMVGGVALLGAAGALLGPLIVRLAAEAMAIARAPSRTRCRFAQRLRTRRRHFSLHHRRRVAARALLARRSMSSAKRTSRIASASAVLAIVVALFAALPSISGRR